MARTTYESLYAIGDAVHIDGDKSLTGMVVGVAFYANYAPSVQVAWMHNGANHEAWIAAQRLSHTDARPGMGA
mgnify:CR=1 FL=1